MALTNPGGWKVREYLPPHLREAMTVTRLANAEWARCNLSTMRYVIVCNVHEGIDPDQPIRILDAVQATHNLNSGVKTGEGEYINVAELLSRLPEDLRKRLLYS